MTQERRQCVRLHSLFWIPNTSVRIWNCIWSERCDGSSRHCQHTGWWKGQNTSKNSAKSSKNCFTRKGLCFECCSTVFVRQINDTTYLEMRTGLFCERNSAGFIYCMYDVMKLWIMSPVALRLQYLFFCHFYHPVCSHNCAAMTISCKICSCLGRHIIHGTPHNSLHAYHNLCI